MKQSLFLTATLTLLVLNSCSKPAESCSFAKSTFENKTLKYALLKVDSSGIDITSRVIAQQATEPCNNNTVTFKSDGTYQTNIATNCSSSSKNGIWSVNTTGGKNYLVVDGDSTEVNSFDCNSMTFIQYSRPFTITYKLVKI